MAQDSFERIPSPGYSSPTHSYAPQEILYSTAGFTQKGVTLAASQGILPAGTVLAQNTVTKRYVVYANGGANGAGTPVGILRRAVDTRTGEQQGNIVIQGILKLSMVSGADSNAITTLNAATNAAMGTFKF
jgi:hypothetical protein